MDEYDTYGLNSHHLQDFSSSAMYHDSPAPLLSKFPYSSSLSSFTPNTIPTSRPVYDDDLLMANFLDLQKGLKHTDQFMHGSVQPNPYLDTFKSTPTIVIPQQKPGYVNVHINPHRISTNNPSSEDEDREERKKKRKRRLSKAQSTSESTTKTVSPTQESAVTHHPHTSTLLTTRTSSKLLLEDLKKKVLEEEEEEEDEEAGEEDELDPTQPNDEDVSSSPKKKSKTSGDPVKIQTQLSPETKTLPSSSTLHRGIIPTMASIVEPSPSFPLGKKSARRVMTSVLKSQLTTIKEREMLARSISFSAKKSDLHTYQKGMEARIHFLAHAFSWSDEFMIQFRALTLKFLPMERDSDFEVRMSAIDRTRLVDGSYYHLVLFMSLYCVGRGLTPKDFDTIVSGEAVRRPQHELTDKDLFVFPDEPNDVIRERLNDQWKFMHECYPGMLGIFTPMMQTQMCMFLIDQMKQSNTWSSFQMKELWDKSTVAAFPFVKPQALSTLIYTDLFHYAKYLCIAMYQKNWFVSMRPLAQTSSEELINRQSLKQKVYKFILAPIWGTAISIVQWLITKCCIDPRFKTLSALKRSKLHLDFSNALEKDIEIHYKTMICSSQYGQRRKRLFAILEQMYIRKEIDLPRLQHQFKPQKEEERQLWASFSTVLPSTLNKQEEDRMNPFLTSQSLEDISSTQEIESESDLNPSEDHNPTSISVPSSVSTLSKKENTTALKSSSSSTVRDSMSYQSDMEEEGEEKGEDSSSSRILLSTVPPSLSIPLHLKFLKIIRSQSQSSK